jgi:hypothetical protein
VVLVGDRGQAADLVGDVDAVGLRHAPELLDLTLKFGDWFFEIKEVAHGAGALAQFADWESLEGGGC